MVKYTFTINMFIITIIAINLLTINLCDAFVNDCAKKTFHYGENYKNVIECYYSQHALVLQYDTFKDKHIGNKLNFITHRTGFDIYKSANDYVTNHNSMDYKYKLELNLFADWTQSRYLDIVGNINYNIDKLAFKNNIATSYNNKPCIFNDVELFDDFDWRKYKVISSIDTIRQYEVSWLYSVVEVFEARNNIKNKHDNYDKLILTMKEHNKEFVHNNLKYYFDYNEIKYLSFPKKYLLENDDIQSIKIDKYKTINDKIISTYEHIFNKGFCNENENCDKLNIPVGYCVVEPNNEEQLKRAVIENPVVVSINANSETFKLYKSGIYNNDDCGNGELNNYALLLVGYGTSSDEIDYWIAKNSWGNKWGDNGYIYIARNINNTAGTCGIASFPTTLIDKTN